MTGSHINSFENHCIRNILGPHPSVSWIDRLTVICIEPTSKIKNYRSVANSLYVSEHKPQPRHNSCTCIVCDLLCPQVKSDLHQTVADMIVRVDFPLGSHKVIRFENIGPLSVKGIFCIFSWTRSRPVILSNIQKNKTTSVPFFRRPVSPSC